MMRSKAHRVPRRPNVAHAALKSRFGVEEILHSAGEAFKLSFKRADLQPVHASPRIVRRLSRKINGQRVGAVTGTGKVIILPIFRRLKQCIPNFEYMICHFTACSMGPPISDGVCHIRKPEAAGILIVFVDDRKLIPILKLRFSWHATPAGRFLCFYKDRPPKQIGAFERISVRYTQSPGSSINFDSRQL